MQNDLQLKQVLDQSDFIPDDAVLEALELLCEDFVAMHHCLFSFISICNLATGLLEAEAIECAHPSFKQELRESIERVSHVSFY